MTSSNDRATDLLHDAPESPKRARRLVHVLHREYGSPDHGNHSDPLDELIYILLSQMTTEPSYTRVFSRLRTRFPSWHQLLDVPVDDLAQLIKDAGLSRQKAPRIKAIVEQIVADFGRSDLALLHDMTDCDVLEYLVSLPGVGVKTAKCVMMYSLDRDVLPVDTHVARVGLRLGLVAESVPSSRLHEELEQAIAPEDRYSFHVNAVAHGRIVCKAVEPRCSGCPLLADCEEGQLW